MRARYTAGAGGGVPRRPSMAEHPAPCGPRLPRRAAPRPIPRHGIRDVAAFAGSAGTGITTCPHRLCPAPRRQSPHLDPCAVPAASLRHCAQAAGTVAAARPWPAATKHRIRDRHPAPSPKDGQGILPRSAHWARAVQRPRIAAPVGPADAAAGRGTRSGGEAPRPASTQRRPCPATPTAWQRPVPPRRWARGGLRLRYVRGQRRHAGAMTIRARKPRGRSATLRWPRRGPRNPRRPGERCRAARGAVPGRSCSRTRLPGIRRFHQAPGLESALSLPLGRTETMNREEHACETG